MLFGVLGDIHGDFATARQVVARHPDLAFWLCVGDVADDEGRYEPLGAPIYWVKGNNENFDAIAARDLPESLHFLQNGEIAVIAGLRVAGLGGTFAPTWYDTPADALPHPRKGTLRATAMADKRRHFVREEVERCKGFQGVDVFLSHEAARPYRVRGGRGPDAGKTPINEVLEAMRPRLHFFGHHHAVTDQVRHGVRSIGLDLASRSYVRVDGEPLSPEITFLST